MLSLKDELIFYRSYHSHPVNQVIHFIFVPVIMFSALVWLAYTPSVADAGVESLTSSLPHWLARLVVLNMGAAVFLAYSTLYIVWDFFAGLSWACLIALPLWLSANYFRMEVPDAWAWALGLQVLAWYMQIHPGHAVFERRKPALMDSFVQAFLTAPFFVWLELLFQLGYRPMLHKAVCDGAARRITAMNQERDARNARVTEPLVRPQ